MRYHFSGIAGAGMNPLAQLMCAWGHQVQGSDRSFDQGKNPELAARLRSAGVTLLPQDGSAVQGGLERFVYSAAVEQETPEVLAAKQLGIERLARPALLAEVVNAASHGIAVSGTSGKSTVTGMIAWILRTTGTPATILGGAALAGEGIAGCFAVGPQGGIVAAEACESDGTLVGYRAGIAVIHNITRDHGELDDLRRQFATFAAQGRLLLVNARCRESLALAASHPQARSYGLGGRADYPLEVLSVGPHTAEGVLGLPTWHEQRELPLRLLHPGAHNLENAAAAAVVCIELGLPPQAVVEALATFPGVARRFEVVGTTDTGIRVVDDYAHNADKIRAAVQAAQAGADRVLAIFQPHGFGPARFLRPELKELLPTLLRPEDRWCYTNIFYAGGSVAQDIHSRDLARDAAVAHADNRQELLLWLSEHAAPGDTVLLMGARDPELPNLARAIHDVL